MKQSSLALIVRNRSPRASTHALAPRDAFLGFRLVALAAIDHETRIAAQGLLLSRISADTALPGSSRAIELRYVVTPACAAKDGVESVACYLLGRISGWGKSSQHLRTQAMRFAESLCDVLAGTLPGLRFEEIGSRRALATALEPFAIADTLEVRRRRLDLSSGEGDLPLPLLGAPDVDSVIELLLRQDAPTLLTLCIEPLGENGNILDPFLNEPLAAPVRQGVSLPYRFAGDEARFDSDEAPGYGEPELRQWHAQRMAALRLAPYRLRIQLASTHPLRESVSNVLASEVGGPGRLLASMAWRAPALPLVAGAQRVRPRSAKSQNTPRSEFDVACDNVRSLGFEPWGADPTGLPLLADFGEGARCFALPSEAPWLPAHGVALPLPFRAHAAEGSRLGVNRVRGVAHPVLFPHASRPFHTWVLGVTGSGKSTLLESMILQDIRAGRGALVVDPHGDLIQQLLGHIPPERIDDVILFDPADREFPLGLNPLDVTDPEQQSQVASSFIGLLTKLYDPYNQGIVGPRFEHGARNVMLTVMSTPGNTLVEVVRAFQDDNFVFNVLLPNVTDPLVKRYWTDQIRSTNSYHRSEVLDWLVSKFNHFVTDLTMRRILGQSHSSFSFRSAMDENKIVLVSLAKGSLGSTNANFLGLVLLPMVLQAALSRADLPAAERHDVGLYIDEFQNYTTDSLAQMLAEARKYHVALTLANQHVGQIQSEIRDALIGNVGSIISFRLGASDALTMEAMLAPSPICATHLTGLPNYTAYTSLLINGQRSPVFTLETEPVREPYDAARALAVRRRSRERYGRPRAEVDAEILARSKME